MELFSDDNMQWGNEIPEKRQNSYIQFFFKKIVSELWKEIALL